MYKQLVASNDRASVQGLSRQVLDPTSRYYGGTIDPGTGVAWVNHTTGDTNRYVLLGSGSG